MRADMMVWAQRLVGLVFLFGAVALMAVVVIVVGEAEGVPPMPIVMGVLGLVALILLAGACMATISIAISARRGVEALSRLAAQGPSLTKPSVAAEASFVPAGTAGPFATRPFGPAAAPPSDGAPTAPAVRRNLVARR